MVLSIPGIKFTPKKLFDKRFSKSNTASFRFVEDRMLEKWRSRGLDTMKRAIRKTTRSRTGRLVNSVISIPARKSGGNLDRRYNIQILVVAPYADFVDRGARASIGAFVPIHQAGQKNFVDGFRIKSGIHPGQSPKRFSDLAEKNLQIQGEKEIGNLWVRTLERAYKFNSGGGLE